VLRKVVAKLDQNGIACVPVKGILLARQLYDDPIDRPLCDVDLLIEPRDFTRAIRAAKAAGWRLHWDSKILGSVNFIVDGVAFDVACSLGPPGLCAVGVDRVMRRAKRQVAPLGFEHLQIDLHDHVLVMAIDAFKDKFGVKPWGREDLIRIAKADGFDPARVVEIAEQARLSTLLAIVADWVLDGGDSAVWSEVRERLRAGKIRTSYAKAFRARMGAPLNGRGSVMMRLLARAASDSPARRVAAVALGAIGTCVFLARHRSLTAPSPRD
jgi:hypothetical protein